MYMYIHVYTYIHTECNYNINAYFKVLDVLFHEVAPGDGDDGPAHGVQVGLYDLVWLSLHFIGNLQLHVPGGGHCRQRQ